ncbi:MAG TPA: hypothetical protein VGM16_13220, partial [Gammaproteobacteria bacterium]
MKLQTFGIGTLGVLLAACASVPLPQDQGVTLYPDQGLAAVMIDTLDPISQVSFQGAGTKLIVAA